MKITNLKQVVDYQLCCGCGLCAYLYPDKIHMIDSPAFGCRPKFTAECECSDIFPLAFQLCPGVSLSHINKKLPEIGQIESLSDHWGPILDIWEGFATDQEIRFKGSSGGAITALALYCLEREHMQGVLHVTPDLNQRYCNTSTLSLNRESLLNGSGSRYSPASPCEKLAEIERATGQCVMIGKPCDIAATERARQLKPTLDVNIGLTIACFCAGTPSTNGTLEMLSQMGIEKPGNLVKLRYRGHGWPGTTVAEQETSCGKQARELRYEESWGQILQKYRQWRCYICPDHTGEFADIAVGDPWYRTPQEGEYGQSLLLARTERGKQIITKAIAAGYLMADKRKPEILPASQSNLLKTRGRLWGQLITLKLFRVPSPSYNGFNLFSAWFFHLTIKEKISSIVGTMKRIYTKKLNRRTA